MVTELLLNSMNIAFTPLLKQDCMGHKPFSPSEIVRTLIKTVSKDTSFIATAE